MKKIIAAVALSSFVLSAFAITSIVTPQSPADAALEQAAVEAESRASEPAPEPPKANPTHKVKEKHRKHKARSKSQSEQPDRLAP